MLQVKLPKKILAAAFGVLAGGLISASSFAATDPVILTFSTVGDSRQDPVAPDSTAINPALVGVGACPVTFPITDSNGNVIQNNGLNPNPGLTGQDCKWQQNSAAWAKIIRNIQAQKPNLLFFNGDMVMGYGKAGVPVASRATSSSGVASEAPITSPAVSDIVGSDLMQFYQQYGFWRGMVANLIETGTYVVPVPGNHETECKRCGKASQAVNEAAWVDNMGDLILDQARLNAVLPNNLTLNASTWNVNNYPGSADGLNTSQKQLSYSFDIGASHFVVINTDPVGNDGHAPNVWLGNDLATAYGNGQKHIFVFGHKPAYYYAFNGSSPSSTSSLNNKSASSASTFWNLITQYKATYFSGHEHIYNVSQPNGGASYQVIVGAGGSPFEDAAATGTAPTDRLYSWATVTIYQSGKVVLNTYGFAPTSNSPVSKLGTFTLTNTQ